MILNRTKTLLLASSIALLTTPAYAWTKEAHSLSGRVEFTDINGKRRHQAKPRQAKARHAKHQQTKRQAVERQSRPKTVRQPAGYDAFASLPDQHAVTGYHAPMRHTPTQVQRRAVERQSRPQRARRRAGYDAFASLPDQHAIDQGFYYSPTNYAPARRAPAPHTSTHHAPPPARSATRSHRVARTHHAEPRAYDDSDLVARARQYMGTNPTGWARVWCGRFMAMIAPDAAARIGNPNLALNWAKLPRTGLQVGAIAVLSRNGGGHVGVVSGIDASGNPIIISGNHNRRVAEAVYPRSRVYAYVRPQ